MENNYQEIADLVARKCQEVLAPLYEELHDLQVQYGMREAEQQPTEPQPDPEEARQAEFKKQLAEMKEMLIKSGRIPKNEAKKSI
ncbi:MAG: hypothetical protein IKB19_00545 [Rikenellaceae bacterium]|nr:hypothetical protein [Rikenellaceae bacterium]